MGALLGFHIQISNLMILFSQQVSFDSCTSRLRLFQSHLANLTHSVRGVPAGNDRPNWLLWCHASRRGVLQGGAPADTRMQSMLYASK